jgi:predicted N-acetyltransferase YhbS
MIRLPSNTKVFLALGTTDMRKAMNGLSITASEQMKKDIFSGNLVKKGLKILAESGIDLVFVLSHPGYYPCYGFTPAGKLDFEAPSPIPEEHFDAFTDFR